MASCRSCLVEENADEIEGSSLRVMLGDSAGSNTNAGATMQCDRRHSGLAQQTQKSQSKLPITMKIFVFCTKDLF